jgi:hypothetical protein
MKQSPIAMKAMKRSSMSRKAVVMPGERGAALRVPRFCKIYKRANFRPPSRFFFVQNACAFAHMGAGFLHFA